MSKRKEKPWDHWQEQKKLSDGGQGWTRLVQRDGTQGVLKILKMQNDPERRKRMRRESVALQTLSHPRIPKFVECNTDKYADPSIDLYIVMEYISGRPLSKVVEESPEGRLGLEAAVLIVTQLIDAVEHAHGQDIIHRDIKPDNILIREDGELYLVDFGLSFNNDDEDQRLTGTEQQVGNRFIALPEFQTPKPGRKGDEISDLTQIVAILFYLVTGKQPMTLRDAEERLPHRRPSSSLKTLALDAQPRSLKALEAFFDAGFQWRPDDRFQTPEQLRRALAEVLKGDSTGEDEQSLLNELDAIHSSNAKWNESLRRKQIISSGLLAIQTAFTKQTSFFRLFEVVGGGTNFSSEVGDCSLGIRLKTEPAAAVHATFWVRLEDAELVVIGKGGSFDGEFWRRPHAAREFDELQKLVREGFLRAMRNLVGAINAGASKPDIEEQT
ncbi:serine/threonine protein kinase [Nannocystis punicea]|uniref:non-specific serine/threonine protein kinase n=1 Tax=Nannocystis punicea TaxID=2995304 RepID=A0ABY7GUB5_9BACT|nr:serine/threonine-protein kinase [Nannocystis poenicansa]WAS90538.1 serine/threonine-protein kinase [Nannocystis poenicansa]